MKGFNVKRLAAIGLGAALVGSALAPVVSAIDLTKADIIDPTTGAPVVDIVVGANAAPSDFIWAGNIAAKVAQLATVSKSATCEGGEEGGTCEPTDLTVDVSVGGEVTYSKESSKTYDNTDLDSNSGTSISAPEFRKEMTSAQLSFLYNSTDNYKYAGTTYSQTIKEIIGIDADARFDKRTTVGDLILYMPNVGDFNYHLSFSKGIPVTDSTDQQVSSTNKFQDGANDNIKIPWFGEMYTVYEVDASGTYPYMRLVKESEKVNYYEGEEITGLKGKNDYAGQDMTVKLVAVTQTGAAAQTYKAQFELYDEEGTLVDTQTVSSGTYLDQTFIDDEGDYALETLVYVETIAVQSTTGVGYVTITQGSNQVELYSGKKYPYDASDTDTSDDGWTVTFSSYTAGSNPDVNVITDIWVKNNAKKWNHENPIYSSDNCLTSACEDGSSEAVFLEGESEDTLGYGFVKVKFDGFKDDKDLTTIKLYGDSTYGGFVDYYDTGDFHHKVPFYIKGTLSTTQQSFKIDDQTFYYRCNSGSSSTTPDVNAGISNGDTFNGVAIAISFPSTGQDGNVVTIGGDRNVDIGSTIDFNGVTGRYDGNIGSTAYFAFDGNCQIATVQFVSASDSDYIGTSNVHNSWFYDDGNIMGVFGSRAYDSATINLTGSGTNDQTFKYAFYVSSESDYGYMWLLLDSDTSFNVQYSKLLTLDGTDTEEDIDVNWTYYLPDDEQFGASNSDDDFYVAIFSIGDDETNYDANIYIDTTTGSGEGDIIALPNTKNLSSYSSDVNYVEAADGYAWSLSTQSGKLTAGWTDFGSKYYIEDGDFIAIMPQDRMKLKTVVLGESTETVVEGAETLEGLAEGDTGTTSSGTKITIDAFHYTSGVCTGLGEPSPATYLDIVPVPQQMVYTDTAPPAGNAIIVGGYLVNSLAEGIVLSDGTALEDALVESGNKVVELLDSGDIIVAGYTAQDTVEAAKELIDALEDLLE